MKLVMTYGPEYNAPNPHPAGPRKATLHPRSKITPEVTIHVPGTPSWFELSASDKNGALAFYSAIFGSAADPQPISENWVYHMQKLNGLEAMAMYHQQEEERNQGVSSHWDTLFTVTNADEAVDKALHSSHGSPKTTSVAV